jgi:hypothetical protein
MGRKVRDKKAPTKVRQAPAPNKEPVTFNLWLLPDPKVKGSEDKWSEPVQITGKNRRAVAKQVRQDYQGRGWKLRLA